MRTPTYVPGDQSLCAFGSPALLNYHFPFAVGSTIYNGWEAMPCGHPIWIANWNNADVTSSEGTCVRGYRVPKLQLEMFNLGLGYEYPFLSASPPVCIEYHQTSLFDKHMIRIMATLQAHGVHGSCIPQISSSYSFLARSLKSI